MVEGVVVLLVVAIQLAVVVFLCRWIFRVNDIFDKLEEIRQLLEVISKR